MSNERIKKAGQTSSSDKDDGKSGSYSGAQFIPKSTSKIPMSVLSPHVAEFIPKSLALKKESSSNGKESAKCLEDKRTQEAALKDVNTVEELTRKAGEGEQSSRGWWDEAPLKIEIDKTTNAPKPQHRIKGLSERTHRPPRDNTKGYPWRQQPLSANMDSNWRSRTSEKPKDIGLGFDRDGKETRKRDFHLAGAATEEKEHCSSQKSFGDRRFWAERRSGKDDSPSALEVVDGRQQIQEGNVRVGPNRERGRGRGRGRMAWINDIQNKSNNLRNDGPKDLKISDQDNIKRVGHGRGFRSNNLSYSAVSQQTSKSGSILTSNKYSDIDPIKKEKKLVASSTAEDDGWIVVGNKKKMDEQKDPGNKTKGKPDIEKSKEINEWDDTSSQQRLEKRKRKRDQKKERKFDNTTEQEGKTIQNKEKISEIITTKDSGKEDKLHKGKGKVVLKYSKDSSAVRESMESDSKTNRKTQEKESKKLEFVKLIKTQQNSSQKEVKILLKRNNESKEAHEEQTVPKDSGFDLGEGDDEFPDLAASSKAGSSSLASDWLSGGSRMPIISYSAVLKAMPKPKTQPSRNLPNEKGSSVMPDKLDQNENEGQSCKKKKKKKKKKAKDNEAKTKQTPQEPKKTKQPMQFDLGDWLSTIEKSPPKTSKDKQTNPKKAVTIATGVLQIKVKDQPSATLRAPAVKATHGMPSTDKTHHNILDSTAPVIKRGKEREVPKKKKPSQMKRIILKEREEKRKTIEGEENQNDKTEQESLAEEGLFSEETSEEHKSEEKSSKEESVKAVDQSQDYIITHHHGNTYDADLSSDGDQTVAPSKDDVKAQIHSRRFREYCDNVMDKELNNTTLQLIQKLVIFQDRLYHRDPVKSKAKRRFVVGLREVTKHLKLKKIKLVIISPNVERIKSAGGLDDTLHNIISIAHQNGVPVVFALRRQVLGRVLHKKVPVSAIGVFYYDGAEDEYKKLMDLTEKARDVYAQRWKAAHDELVERIQKERAEEMSRDVQEEDSEIPGESKTEMKNNQDKVSEDTDKKSNITEIRKMEEDEEPECNRNQENEWENEEEMKDDDDLEIQNVWSEKEELDERNEKENELEREEGMKEELCDQKENISEYSDDGEDLKKGNIEDGKMELKERNETENELDNDDNSVSIERDLRVEDL